MVDIIHCRKFWVIRWSHYCPSSLSSIILPAFSPLKWTRVLTISLISSHSGHKFPYFNFSARKHLHSFSANGLKLLPPFPRTHINTSCYYSVYLKLTANLVRYFPTWKRVSILSILLGQLSWLFTVLSLSHIPPPPCFLLHSTDNELEEHLLPNEPFNVVIVFAIDFQRLLSNHINWLVRPSFFFS